MSSNNNNYKRTAYKNDTRNERRMAKNKKSRIKR